MRTEASPGWTGHSHAGDRNFAAATVHGKGEHLCLARGRVRHRAEDRVVGGAGEQRQVLPESRLLAVKGAWERRGPVTNLIAHTLWDLTPWLERLGRLESRDIR